MATILLHAEGDARTGLGHLVRMVGVAGELAGSHRVHLASASPHAAAVVAELAPWARGAFDVRALAPGEEHPWARGEELAAGLVALAADMEPSLLVSDGKAAFPAEGFAALRARCRVVLVDNVVAAAGAYDHLVLPTCHADPAVLARLGPDRVETGPAWTFLHPAVRALAEGAAPARAGTFVSMGGADPRGLTGRAVRHLLVASEGRVVAVVGPANRHAPELEELAREDARVQLVHGSPASQEALASAERALCAFGITAYEAIALGVPLLVVPHDGVVDGDLARFTATFHGRAEAIATPEQARAWPSCSRADAPRLGGLAVSLASLLGPRASSARES